MFVNVYFGFLPNDFIIIYHSSLSIINVPAKGYCKGSSCALN